MPDVSTNRTRDVTIAGNGTFGVDSAAVFHPVYNIGGGPQNTRDTWLTNSAISYWGSDVTATVDTNTGWSSGNPSTPSVTITLSRAGASRSATAFGSSYTGTTFTNPVPQSVHYFSASQGFYSFTETVHCVQHFQTSGTEASPYERRTPVSFSATASISATFVNTVGSGSQTISVSVTLTDADIPAFASFSYSSYLYSYGFNGMPVHFPNTAQIAFDSPGLISAYGGIVTTYGKARLAGDGSSITWSWSGSDTDINPDWFGGNPAAQIDFLPSWAMSVGANCYRYGDGSIVPTSLQHWYETDHVGDFGSGSSYRYPGSGLIDWLALNFFNSGQQRNGHGFQTGSPVPGDANYDTSIVLSGNNYGPIGKLLQKPGDPELGKTQFRVDPDWANAHPTYIKSDTLPDKCLPTWLGQPFQQGTIQWDATHRFQLFERGGVGTALSQNPHQGDTTLHVLSSAGFTNGDTIFVGTGGIDDNFFPPLTFIVTGTGTGTISVSPPVDLTGITVLSGYPVFRSNPHWGWSLVVTLPEGQSRSAFTVPGISLSTGGGIDGNALQVDVYPGANGSPCWSAVGQSDLPLLHQGFRYAKLHAKGLPPATTLSAGTSIGDQHLPVNDAGKFRVGDTIVIDSGLTTEETISVTSVAAGDLGVATTGFNHSLNATVRRTTACNAILGTANNRIGGGTNPAQQIGWNVSLPVDGTFSDTPLDLELPDLVGKPSGSYPYGTWATNAGELYPPALFFPDPPELGDSFGAPITIYFDSPGTYTFDYLEGYRNTDGNRTPILLLPFLDGENDTAGLDDNPDLLVAGNPEGGFAIMRSIINGADAWVLAPGVSLHDTWVHLADKLNSNTNHTDISGNVTPNDTGITVVEGVNGDPHPYSVFGSRNMGQPAFGPSGIYGSGATAGSALSIGGQLRQQPINNIAYYGCGDLTSESGGYDAVVQFTIDWVWEGEAIACLSGDASSSVLTLVDDDTEAVVKSAEADDDGMARLPAPYGVFLPLDNRDDSPQWYINNPPFTRVSAPFILAPATDIPVQDSTFFSIGGHVTIGNDLTLFTITNVVPGQISVDPPTTVLINFLDPVEAVVASESTIGWTPLGMGMNPYWIKGVDVDAQEDGDGYILIAGAAPPTRKLVPIRDRHQTFIQFAGSGAADTIFYLRNSYWHRHLVMKNTSKGLVSLRYGERDDNPHTDIIDPSTNCSFPSFWMNGTLYEGTYLKGTLPTLARHLLYGRTDNPGIGSPVPWNMFSIPGSYTALTSTYHRGRVVVVGFHGSSWYVRVGNPKGGSPYLWSNEVALSGAANASKKGFVRDREDGALEFAYIDTSGNPHVVVCKNLDNNANGTWG